VAKVRIPLPPPPPDPLTPAPTTEFKKDSKRQAKRGKDMAKLRAVIETLCSRTPLAARHNDHALVGDWKGWRDCHVSPDWLLIYKATETELILGRTGTHADIFE
jgi:mRNA interferase YafQ